MPAPYTYHDFSQALSHFIGHAIGVITDVTREKLPSWRGYETDLFGKSANKQAKMWGKLSGYVDKWTVVPYIAI